MTEIKDLPQNVQDKVADLEEQVQKQQDAIDAVQPALEALMAGVETKGDQAKIVEHLRWTESEFTDFSAMTEEEQQGIVDNICAVPYAYFYVADPPVQVYLQYGSAVEVRDPDHLEY